MEMAACDTCRYWQSSRKGCGLFSVFAAAVALVQVPTELREFRTLLHTLGVPERFRPGDYLAVLKTMETAAKGRPLDATALGVAVGERAHRRAHHSMRMARRRCT